MEHLFASLGLLQPKNPFPISSLTLFLLACVAGQPGARPTVYVRGIIRISYRARKGEGREGEWKKRSAEVVAEEGLSEGQKR